MGEQGAFRVLELVNAEFLDPAYGLLAAIVVVALLTVFALVSKKLGSEPTDPLAGLFSRSTFEAEAQAGERRMSPKRAREAVLYAQVDHLAQVRTLWGPEARAEAIEKIAQVMRASLRDDDAMVDYEGPDGDGSFVILAAGADEDQASVIAKRLLRNIAETPIPAMGNDMRMSARFGVAAPRAGESNIAAKARAEAALKAAQSASEEEVITASNWEEIKFLPAPRPRKSANKAA